MTEVRTNCKTCKLRRHCGADRFLYDCRHYQKEEPYNEKVSDRLRYADSGEKDF